MYHKYISPCDGGGRKIDAEMMRIRQACDEREGFCAEDKHHTVGAADKYTISSYTDGIRSDCLGTTSPNHKSQ